MNTRRTVREDVTGLRHQRGGALIVMLVVFVLGTSWLFIDALATAPNRATSNHREENAAVLSQAKLALIGWVASKAVEAGENNPGRVPCPEAPGYIGTANEGIAAGNCTLPAVGRLPWRTLGLSKLLDASGEPLWYVVSPGPKPADVAALPPHELTGPWALNSPTATLRINSYTRGWLTLDGTANAAVALIVAPGRALEIKNPLPNGDPLPTECVARNQTRGAVPPDFRDYLECENALNPTDPEDTEYAKFVTRGPRDAFNDQVVALRTDDLIPVIEAAIADRINREIAPRLRSVYGTNFNISSSSGPIYPYAAPFANPGPGTGTSSYLGVASNYQGLLPFNQTQGCTDPADPRCLPNLVGWTTSPWSYEAGGWGWQDAYNCYWEGGSSPTYDARVCEGTYQEDPACSDPACGGLVIGLTAKFSNVALGLRALDATKVEILAYNDPLPSDESLMEPGPTTASVSLAADGTATVTITGTVPNINSRGWGQHGVFRLRVKRQVIGDHPLLDPNDPTTGWFVRNEWYRLLYYAVAQGQTAAYKASLPCAEGTNCLQYKQAGVTDDGKRAVVLLAGRSLGSQTRPGATLSDYLDTAENTNGNTLYEQARIDRSVNDRVIIVDENPNP